VLRVTLLAAHDVSGRLPDALDVRGRHVDARSMARIDVVWNSFFLDNPVRGCVPAMALLPRRLHAV
jgi:hypothetical protein